MTAKEASMFYDLTLTRGDDRGSIRPVRKYKTKNKLTAEILSDINKVLDLAIDASGVRQGVEQELYIDFSESWVDERKDYDETHRMLTADYWMLETPDTITSKSPRNIAKQLLTDLASAEDWDFLFEGDAYVFDTMDFKAFDLTDNTVDNENLKVPIGTKVYLRGWSEAVFTYQGRPTAEHLKNNVTFYVQGKNVWSTDENIIAVDDFKVSDYVGDMETFPLPVNYSANFFAREKNKGRTRKETFGKTQKEAKLRLALILAFEATKITT
jgi:hypothetical protein